MNNFETTLRNHVLLRWRLCSNDPTQANRDRLYDGLFLLEAFEKETLPVKYKPSKEILNDFYKLIDSIGNIGKKKDEPKAGAG